MRVSKLRSFVPVLAVTPQASTCRRANLYWGVTPLRHRFVSNSDNLRASVERTLTKRDFISPGDPVAWLGGVQPGRMAHDFLQLREVPQLRQSGTSTAVDAAKKSRRKRDIS